MVRGRRWWKCVIYMKVFDRKVLLSNQQCPFSLQVCSGLINSYSKKRQQLLSKKNSVFKNEPITDHHYQERGANILTTDYDYQERGANIPTNGLEKHEC